MRFTHYTLLAPAQSATACPWCSVRSSWGSFPVLSGTMCMKLPQTRRRSPPAVSSCHASLQAEGTISFCDTPARHSSLPVFKYRLLFVMTKKDKNILISVYDRQMHVFVCNNIIALKTLSSAYSFHKPIFSIVILFSYNSCQQWWWWQS